jgi:hypothetical protein
MGGRPKLTPASGLFENQDKDSASPLSTAQRGDPTRLATLVRATGTLNAPLAKNRASRTLFPHLGHLHPLASLF